MFLPTTQKAKTITFLRYLFTTPTSKKYRLAFFVLVGTILLFNFSAKTTLAATITGDPPQPGMPISNYPAWQTAINNYNGYYKDDLLKMISSGNVPTSPSAYGSFLKAFGGYSWQETDAAGIKYASSFAADPNTNTWWARSFGYSDDYLLSKWQNGQNTPQATTTQKAMATAAMSGTKLGDWAASQVWKFVIGVLAIIAYFCKLLLMYAGQALDVTLNPSLYNFTNNQLVVQGWIVVRDVCNLFFLLVLLFIAICTILQIPKYHAKKTLLTLIIMALLINFSKPIAVFIFDGSQLLMNMFLSEIMKNGQAPPSAKLAADIGKFLYDELATDLGTQQGSMEIAVYYLFLVVFLFMFAVALFVMFLFMMIRIVAVMILVIVSPLAFFAAIVPDFSGMSSKWWKALFEYSYYGPAAAFFLFLAAKFSIATSNILPQVNLQVQGTGGQVIQHIIVYFVVLVFLYASIIMAKQFGGGAGAAIVGNANKFMKWAGGMGKGGGMWGGIARGTGVADVYKGVKGGIAQRPRWRILTKEGREAASKERQERWKERTAPFNIATARKKAKELEGESHATIDAGVDRGDAASIMESAKRGRLTPAQLAANQDILIANADLRADVFKNLRESGNSHLQYDFEIANAAALGVSGAPNDVYDRVYGRMSNNNLAENQNLRQALINENTAGGTNMLARLDNLDENALNQLQNRTRDPGAQFVIQRLIARRAAGNLPGTATHADLT